MKSTCAVEIYTESVYKRLMTEIEVCIIRPQLTVALFLSEDKFIFSRTITSKIFGKQSATAVPHNYYF
jgi:hypothetical protein